MITVLVTANFQDWLAGIKDLATRLRLARRLEKAQRGNFGDIKRLTNFFMRCENFLVSVGECITFSKSL